MTKYKENTKQHKIEILNTLLKDYPGFSLNDDMSMTRDVAVEIIDEAVTHQFKSAT